MEDTIDYGALFGIDDQGEEMTEAAEPSGETEAPGEKEQEAAEPAVVEKKEEKKESTETESGATQPGETGQIAARSSDAENRRPRENPEELAKTRQSPEENAAYAAARRKAEAQRDAAIEKAKADARAEAERYINDAFANSGLVNPYTKEKITSKDAYDAYRQRYEDEKKKSVMRKSGMSDEEFREFVESLPEVRAAKEAQEQAKRETFKAREERAKAQIEQQLEEIHQLDPDITGMADLAKLEHYDRFRELVQKGLGLTDAYKLVNFEKLTEKAAAARKQAMLNASASKAHLTPTAQRGAGAQPVPEDVRKAYRTYLPDATDSEIQRHYNTYLRGRK